VKHGDIPNAFSRVDTEKGLHLYGDTQITLFVLLLQNVNLVMRNVFVQQVKTVSVTGLYVTSTHY
jgi:hypothetical protein